MVNWKGLIFIVINTIITTDTHPASFSGMDSIIVVVFVGGGL